MKQDRNQDFQYALALLFGTGFLKKEKTIEGYLKKKAPEFPSNSTKPTEKEARAALARLLKDNPGQFILHALAALFSPEEADDIFGARRRVVFKNLGSDRWRENMIAMAFQSLRKKGVTYEKAAEGVATVAGISERHAKRIYDGRRRAARKRAMTPRRPPDVMTSDG